MPAKSKSQQRFMGMVRQCQKTGECASDEVSKAADSISTKEAKKFAKTKTKGLPEKISENKLSFREFLMEGYKNQHRWQNRAANQMGAGANLDNSEQNKEHVLNVPYELRHEAKKYGAKWDQGIEKWVIRGEVPDALKDMLPIKDQKIYLNVPYREKDEAKKYGAKWDGSAKKWYYAGNNPPMELNKWRTE